MTACYGFMQTPNAPSALEGCKRHGLDIDLERTSYYLGRETLLTSGRSKMSRWRKGLFAFISRNARPATAYFGLPPNRVVELGMQVDFRGGRGDQGPVYRARGRSMYPASRCSNAWAIHPAARPSAKSAAAVPAGRPSAAAIATRPRSSDGGSRPASRTRVDEREHRAQGRALGGERAGRVEQQLGAWVALGVEPVPDAGDGLAAAQPLVDRGGGALGPARLGDEGLHPVGHAAVPRAGEARRAPR